MGLFYNDTRLGPRNPHGARWSWRRNVLCMFCHLVDVVKLGFILAFCQCLLLDCSFTRTLLRSCQRFMPHLEENSARKTSKKLREWEKTLYDSYHFFHFSLLFSFVCLCPTYCGQRRTFCPVSMYTHASMCLYVHSDTLLT